MKRLMVSVLACITCIGLSAQQIDKSALKKTYKSKRTTNVIVGWTLLAGGTGLIIAGAAKDPGKKNTWTIGLAGEYENSGEKASMIVGGVLLAGGSLIFFEFANRNKQKLLDLGLTTETVTHVTKGSFVKSTIPAITLKLTL